MVRAFFIGRALAGAIAEQVEATITDSLSELGRFDAEQREKLRQFTDEVMARAEQEQQAASQTRPGGASTGEPEDLQATIDNLRAEIAQVRAAMQQYRAATN